MNLIKCIGGYNSKNIDLIPLILPNTNFVSSLTYLNSRFIYIYLIGISSTSTHPVYLLPDPVRKSSAIADSKRVTSPTFAPCERRSYQHSVVACLVRCPDHVVTHDPPKCQTHRRPPYPMIAQPRCHYLISYCVLALRPQQALHCRDSIDPPEWPCGTDASALCQQYESLVLISSRS